MPTVLLATDGSEYARRAARRALDLAGEGGTVHVLCVVDRRKLDEPALSSDELATIVAEDHGFECVEEVREMADGTGVVVDGDVCHGVPADVILEYADEVDATAIVVGAHGEHTDHFGGVGRQVTAESTRDVVVVDGED